MKTCDYCQKPATVTFTKVINGESQEVSLCASCCKLHGNLFDFPFIEEEKTSAHLPVASFNLPGLKHLGKEEDKGQCPHCGMGIEWMKKTGKMGCSHCYTRFKTILESSLVSMHHGQEHCGHVPPFFREKKRLLEQQTSLRKAMEKAVKEEDYEKALELRNALKHLGAQVEGL